MSKRFGWRRCAPPLVLLGVLGLLIACGGEAPGLDVELQLDGLERVIHTQAATVAELLREQGVSVRELDRVAPPTWTELKPSMIIRVTRVEERFEVATSSLPYGHRTVRDEALPIGESKLVQLGANGIEELTFRILAEDGKEISRTLTRRTTVKPPVDEIAVVGAKGSLPAVPITGTLVYASGGNAWLVRETTAGRRPLTSEGDLDLRAFALSPDGAQLVFTRSVPDGDDSPLNTLWLLDTMIIGEPARQLPFEGVLFAAWSPDGQRLALSTAERSTGAPGWRANNDLWVAESPGFSPTLVVSPSSTALYSWWGETFRWAPDGQRLAYGNASEIGIIDLRSGTRRTLVEFPTYNSRSSWVWTPVPNWSPDGRFLVAAVHGPSGREAPEDSPLFDIWAIGVDSGLTIPLAREAGMWATPTWSPTSFGNAPECDIAFGVAELPAHSQYSRYLLYVVDRDGSNRHPLFAGEDGVWLDVLDFAWSPDGKALVVVRQGDLVLVDVSTGKSSPVTSDGNSSRPVWAR